MLEIMRRDRVESKSAFGAKPRAPISFDRANIVKQADLPNRLLCKVLFTCEAACIWA
jgi:hypothetical protein